jgi:hypothetical protein
MSPILISFCSLLFFSQASSPLALYRGIIVSLLFRGTIAKDNSHHSRIHLLNSQIPQFLIRSAENLKKVTLILSPIPIISSSLPSSSHSHQFLVVLRFAERLAWMTLQFSLQTTWLCNYEASQSLIKISFREIFKSSCTRPTRKSIPERRQGRSGECWGIRFPFVFFRGTNKEGLFEN